MKMPRVRLTIRVWLGVTAVVALCLGIAFEYERERRVRYYLGEAAFYAKAEARWREIYQAASTPDQERLDSYFAEYASSRDSVHHLMRHPESARHTAEKYAQLRERFLRIAAYSWPPDIPDPDTPRF